MTTAGGVNWRLWILQGALLLVVLALAARLFELQILRHEELAKQASEFRKRSKEHRDSSEEEST